MEPKACNFVEPKACNFVEPKACNLSQWHLVKRHVILKYLRNVIFELLDVCIILHNVCYILHFG